MRSIAKPPDPDGGAQLDRAECLRLLGSAPVGRVVFSQAALPAAQPVAYLLDDEEVLFHAEPGSRFAAATRNRVVAFQVDDVDAPARRGWSLLGVGEAYEVLEPTRLAALTRRLPVLWVRSTGALHTMSVPMQLLSGRRW
jgi:nitroimidazol reductase NimA-like FMN-containing flavoprotein (pyridoxamine 5'-phosphate oxidase superfamily)